MTKAVLLLLFACACSHPAPEPSAPPAQSASPSQSVSDAVHLLCDAPTRAEADPKFHSGDPAEKSTLLGAQLKSGITNARVLATVDGWKDPNKTGDAKVADLDALTKEAGMTEHCALRDVWASR